MKIFNLQLSFTKVFILLFLFTLLNFFLTPSPYSALHSGRTNFSNSENFTLNPAYLLLFSILIGWFTTRRFPIKGIGLYLLISILISFVANFSITGINTYLFDAFSIYFTAIMAFYDSHRVLASTNDYSVIKRICIIFCFIGFILVILFNGTYGYFSLSMSRENRGEITLWVILCIPLLLLSLSFVDYLKRERTLKLLTLAIISCLITVMTGSRAPLMTYFVCVLLLFYGKIRSSKLFILLIPIIILVIATSSWFQSTMLLGNSSLNADSADEILNGRFELWQLYWEALTKNWIFGAGPNILPSNYTGAGSEIGILKSITHYGIIWGIVECWMIFISAKKGIAILKSNTFYSSFTLLMCFVFFSNVILLFEHHARIMNVSDFLFWYSMFYLYQIKINSNEAY